MEGAAVAVPVSPLVAPRGLRVAMIALACVAIAGVIVLVVLAAVQCSRRRAARRPRPSVSLLSTLDGAGGARAGTYSAGTTYMVPLHWNRTMYVMEVPARSLRIGLRENETFETPGAGSTVSAVLDSGSFRLIVASTECTTCDANVYDDTTGRPQGCQSLLSYGSQSDLVKNLIDSVSFGRIECGASTTRIGALHRAPIKPGIELRFEDMPVGAVVENQGSSSANIIGMSSVKKGDLLQTSGASAFCDSDVELQSFASPVIDALAKAVPASDPVVWTMAVGYEGGGLWFRSVRGPGAPPFCLALGPWRTSPMLRVLPRAEADLPRVPFMYYVLEVAAVSGLPDGYVTPRYMIIDTGTTGIEIPVRAGAPPPRDPTAAFSVTFKGGARLDIQPTYGEENYTVLSPLDATASVEFAGAPDGGRAPVGILGVNGMRGYAVEFQVEAHGFPAQISFARLL